MAIVYIISDGAATPVGKTRVYGLSPEEIPLMDVCKRIYDGIVPSLGEDEGIEVTRDERIISVHKYRHERRR